MEAFMYRFHPQIEKAREIVVTGEIGEINLVRSGFSFYFPEEDLRKDYRGKKEFGGGALYDIGCYCVNISRYFLGNPDKVFATAIFHPHLGIDLSGAAILSFPGGKIALIDWSFRRPLHRFCKIEGEKGSLLISLPFITLPEPTWLILRKNGKEKTYSFPPLDVYEKEVEAFSRSIRGEVAPLLPPQDSLGNSLVLDGLRSSINSREAVSKLSV